jgi:3-dehydroquinate dehydratase-2
LRDYSITVAQQCIYILNGPNLNLLDQREPDLYGTSTLDDIEKLCRQQLAPTAVQLVFRQTNHEGILVEWVQEAREKAHVLILNATGLTHTSIILHDALSMLKIPLIEIHLTQPLMRESFRHHSYVSPLAQGIIAGFGINSYKFATEAALTWLQS